MILFHTHVRKSIQVTFQKSKDVETEDTDFTQRCKLGITNA